ncbi:hypothetical protein GCM10023231_13320 [Olivibacter ginsenosidimutans]|uniref:Zinc-ribbon domain-containing protein n=1 Tax=Olivibacter ginsenosidimutans TaxID=1176537 RepID=A0ABP9AV80_9SPHI
MIIFGTRGSLVNTSEPKANCVYCGSEHSVGFHGYVRYFHIFWIPVFPYSRKVMSYCAHCRQVLSKEEMPADLAIQAKTERPRLRLWHFSGIGLIVACLAFAGIAESYEKKQTKTFMQDPEVGDVYGIKLANGHYTLCVLSKIEPDSLGFRMNNYEVDAAADLSKLRNHYANDYEDSLYFWPKFELERLLNENYIVQIKRDK